MNKSYKLTTVLLCILIVLSSVFVLISCADSQNDAPKFLKSDAEGYACIYLEDGKDLNVLVLGDPQLDANTSIHANMGADNEKTKILVERFLNLTKPDLVIIPGDLLIAFFKDNRPFLRYYIELFEKHQVPWMPVFGNHDTEKLYVLLKTQADKNEVCDMLSASEYCLISKGDAEEGGGIGNYFVNVKNRQEKILFSFCAMDCVMLDDGQEYHREKTPEQIEWYEKHILNIKRLNGGEVVPSILFAHTSVTEIKTGYDLAFNGGNPTEDYLYGTLLEGDRTNYDNLFEKAVELGSTKAMIFGHHHSNDAMIRYQDIILGYARHTSFSDYYRYNYESTMLGSLKSVDWTTLETYGDQRGATSIKIKHDGTFQIIDNLASEVFEDYHEFAIDYKAVYEELQKKGIPQTGIPYVD